MLSKCSTVVNPCATDSGAPRVKWDRYVTDVLYAVMVGKRSDGQGDGKWHGNGHRAGTRGRDRRNGDAVAAVQMDQSAGEWRRSRFPSCVLFFNGCRHGRLIDCHFDGDKHITIVFGLLCTHMITYCIRPDDINNNNICPCALPRRNVIIVKRS